jgi:hypothetical protein
VRLSRDFAGPWDLNGSEAGVDNTAYLKLCSTMSGQAKSHSQLDVA